ncbi:MAG: NAD(P)/FAD-dependent oxidoreductase [Chloroflexi bacterium]|nr:NAD(P)/FAD-dependent oxidoreductase [Chloroflexota bacterium]
MRSGPYDFDSVVVGSGPNGLAAAITLAQHGLSTVIYEKSNSAGGGVRSAEITLPGFIHDTGAAVYPMAVASSFFSSLPLKDYGLQWIYPPASLSHPFDDGTAAVLESSFQATGTTLGDDAKAYYDLIKPVADVWKKLEADLLGTLRSLHHPLVTTSFGLKALNSAAGLIDKNFKGRRARGFFAGLAAHSVIPLGNIPSAAIGIVLCTAGHTVGWPIPRGGAGSITAALVKYFESLGGKIVTGKMVTSLSDLPRARLTLLDTSPDQVVKIYRERLPPNYCKAVMRYQYGPGIFKIDWALSGPIPWKAQECLRSGTVHLGGTFEEIVDAELNTWQGRIVERPFVILAQPSLFDPTRASDGKHTAWAYCHVPNGCNIDMTDRIEHQVERFAPGFHELVLARSISTPISLQQENPNLVGGDIVGGAQTLKQMFCRPTCKLVPYSIPVDGVYLCSASTPPGAGVHGMCGFHAAQTCLRSIKK